MLFPSWCIHPPAVNSIYLLISPRKLLLNDGAAFIEMPGRLSASSPPASSLDPPSVSDWLIGADHSLGPYLKRYNSVTWSVVQRGPPLSTSLPMHLRLPYAVSFFLLQVFHEEYTFNKSLVHKSLSLALLLESLDLRQ